MVVGNEGTWHMAKLSHEEQVEVVRKAFVLETAIAVEHAEIELVKDQTFDQFPAYETVFPDKPPVKPQRIVNEAPSPVDAVIPKPPNAAYTFGDHLKGQPLWIVLLVASVALSIMAYRGAFGASIVGLLLTLVCTLSFPAWCVGFLVSCSHERNRRNQELANSPAYLQSVAHAKQQAAAEQAEVELQARQEQARLDAQYDVELKHYNEVLLPSYEQAVANNKREYEEMKVEYAQDKEEWESRRSEAIALLEQDVIANKAALDELYETSGIISLHYRQIPLREWLYDDMRSSDHDIRYATELLDRDRQRIVTEEAAARTVSAVDRLREQVHSDASGIMLLQGVQIQGLRNLEAVSSDILYTTEDIYDSGKKVLFHQRVGTADKALREWRRHKAKQAAKRA